MKGKGRKRATRGRRADGRGNVDVAREQTCRDCGSVGSDSFGAGVTELLNRYAATEPHYAAAGYK